jgi:hypothetical protein
MDAMDGTIARESEFRDSGQVGKRRVRFKTIQVNKNKVVEDMGSLWMASCVYHTWGR